MADVIESRDYAIFQDHGYRGLYGGLGAKDIHRRRGLKKGQQILDHMGSTELAANLFRTTQTEEKLRRDSVFLLAPVFFLPYTLPIKKQVLIKD